MREHLDDLVKDGTAVPLLAPVGLGASIACPVAVFAGAYIMAVVYAFVAGASLFLLRRAIKAGPTVYSVGRRWTFKQRLLASLIGLMLLGIAVWPLSLLAEVGTLWWSIDSLAQKLFILAATWMFGYFVFLMYTANRDSNAFYRNRT
jgi:hypothetical protein